MNNLKQHKIVFLNNYPYWFYVVEINDESLMRQLRGDLYKLSKEKDRLQRDNEVKPMKYCI